MEWIETTGMRLPRARALPFIVGLLEQAGWSRQWVAFAVADAWFHRGGRFVADLPPELRALLACEAGAAPFDLVLTSEVACPDLLALLRQSATGARILALQDANVSSVANVRTDDLVGALGLAPSDLPRGGTDRHLVDDVRPVYGRRIVGEQVPSDPGEIAVALVGEVACAYGAAVTRNPCYQGLDAPEVLAHRGCAFCGHVERPDRGGRAVTAWDELALAQVEAHQRAFPAMRSRPRYVVEDARVGVQAGRFLRKLLARPLQASTFALGLRVDDVGGFVAALEEHAAELVASGHGFELFDLGVENFSASENLRFNKGFGAEAVWRSLADLDAFRARHPGVLQFEPQRALSAILFTPWTTPADLLINLEAARRLGPAFVRYLLGTRLQIVPGRAIEVLARRDGALAPSFDDVAAIDPVCVTEAGLSELAWRFLDVSTRRLHCLLVRLEPVPDSVRLAPDDEGWRRLNQARALLPADLDASHQRLAEALVHAVVQLGPQATEIELCTWIAGQGAGCTAPSATPRGLSFVEARRLVHVVAAFTAKLRARGQDVSLLQATTHWGDGLWTASAELQRQGRRLGLIFARRRTAEQRATRFGEWLAVSDVEGRRVTTDDRAFLDALVQTVESCVEASPAAR